MATGERAEEGEMTPAPLTPADVVRIGEERRSSPQGTDGWIGALTREQALAECERQGLELSGLLPVLRERLRKHERAARAALDRSLDPYGGWPMEEGISRLSRVTAQESAETESRGIPSRGQNGAIRRVPNPETGSMSVANDRGRRHGSREQRIESPRRRAGVEMRSANEALKLLRQWNVSFSGARGADADAFLQRIHEGRKIAAVGDEEILDCLPFVLSDIALVWFRVKRSDWGTWSDFERAFRSRFTAPDFQWELNKEILLRTQGEAEPVADFLACMLGMFARLDPPWPLTRQLACAHGNLLPRYQLTVRRGDFRDFKTLEALVVESETRYAAFDHYRPPPSPEDSLLPSLACRTSARGARQKAPVSAAAITGVSAALEPSAGAWQPRCRESGSGKARREPRMEKTPEKGQAGKPRRAASRERDRRRAGNAYEDRRGRKRNRDDERKKTREIRGNCWRCDRPGHFARDCRESPRSQCCAGCRCREPVTPAPAEGGGKRVGKDVKRAAAPSSQDRAHEISESLELSAYGTYDPQRLSSLGYVTVRIGGAPLRGVLDSGANGSFIGREALKAMRPEDRTVERVSPIKLRLANGTTALLTEVLRRSVELEGRTATLRFYVVPDSPLPLVLGLDFILAFRIVLNFSRGEWYFGDAPSKRYPFEEAPGEVKRMCGLSMLSDGAAAARGTAHEEAARGAAPGRSAGGAASGAAAARGIVPGGAAGGAAPGRAAPGRAAGGAAPGRAAGGLATRTRAAVRSAGGAGVDHGDAVEGTAKGGGTNPRGRRRPLERGRRDRRRQRGGRGRPRGGAGSPGADIHAGGATLRAPPGLPALGCRGPMEGSRGLGRGGGHRHDRGGTTRVAARTGSPVVARAAHAVLDGARPLLERRRAGPPLREMPASHPGKVLPRMQAVDPGGARSLQVRRAGEGPPRGAPRDSRRGTTAKETRAMRPRATPEIDRSGNRRADGAEEYAPPEARIGARIGKAINSIRFLLWAFLLFICMGRSP